MARLSRCGHLRLGLRSCYVLSHITGMGSSSFQHVRLCATEMLIVTNRGDASQTSSSSPLYFTSSSRLHTSILRLCGDRDGCSMLRLAVSRGITSTHTSVRCGSWSRMLQSLTTSTSRLRADSLGRDMGNNADTAGTVCLHTLQTQKPFRC